jgi:hypothetical protein
MATSGSRGLALVAIFSFVLTSTEHAEVVLPTAVLFFLSKTAILA